LKFDPQCTAVFDAALERLKSQRQCHSYLTPFYSNTFLLKSGDWKDTHSLSETANLKLAYLITKATDAIQELKAIDREDAAEQSDTDYDNEAGP
ncbi:MAG: hypothetical protein AAFP90_18915, partial [Planctomycetota bacterium]